MVDAAIACLGKSIEFVTRNVEIARNTLKTFYSECFYFLFVHCCSFSFEIMHDPLSLFISQKRSFRNSFCERNIINFWKILLLFISLLEERRRGQCRGLGPESQAAHPARALCMRTSLPARGVWPHVRASWFVLFLRDHLETYNSWFKNSFTIQGDECHSSCTQQQPFPFSKTKNPVFLSDGPQMCTSAMPWTRWERENIWTINCCIVVGNPLTTKLCALLINECQNAKSVFVF